MLLRLLLVEYSCYAINLCVDLVLIIESELYIFIFHCHACKLLRGSHAHHQLVKLSGVH